MKRIYSRAWFVGKEERLGEYKGSGSRIQEEDKYKSEIIEEVKYSRKKKL